MVTLRLSIESGADSVASDLTVSPSSLAESGHGTTTSGELEAGVAVGTWAAGFAMGVATCANGFGTDEIVGIGIVDFFGERVFGFLDA
jgi:hypothetical protein